MRTYEGTTMVAGVTFAENAAGVASLRKTVDEGKSFPVFLVPDPDNKYDKSAVRVVAQTPLGRRPLGHVPARRYCPHCDPLQKGRGHKAYGNDAVAECPECQTPLPRALNAQLAELLSQPDCQQLCSASFLGGIPGKENVGVLVHYKMQVGG